MGRDFVGQKAKTDLVCVMDIGTDWHFGASRIGDAGAVVHLAGLQRSAFLGLMVHDERFGLVIGKESALF